MSGLYSPILEQAGFLKRKAADVVEQWVAQLDGATQSWIFSEEIPLISGDEITFSILANDAHQAGSAMIFSYLGNYRTLLRVEDGVFVTGFGEVAENGSAVTHIATDGNLHTYTLKIEFTGTAIYYIGAQYDGANLIRHLSNAVFDIVITRPSVGVILDLPLTNKAQGATQLATVGNINAFMPNYTDAVWRKP
ncbi:MAG: hypothetical protein ACI87I_001823 [Pseudoalteromonas tetraodonis]|jgi:hypothetical protein|uniref:hypothetical protein n=1 Tax=Pseudoalteromonas tetraodonis TaxID=43659 RepID=UPI003989963D